jgi:transposase
VQPAIINPRLAKAFAESLSVTNRTDKSDARTLARYGAERQPAPFAPPTPALEQLRDLTRYRQALVEALTEEKNRAAEGAAAATVRRIRTRRIQQLERDIARMEKELRTRLQKLPQWQRDVDQLDGIFGVGGLTAVTVVAELGDLRRFTRARQLTAFAGLAPTAHDSGTSVHKKSHTSKNGSTRVRRVLYLAAMAAIKGDNDFAALHRRLIAAGKPFMVAIVAVMRKLLLVMRAILISGETYNPHQRTATGG